MHAFGVDDTLQFLALFSCCLDVDQFKRAQVVWFWEVLKPIRGNCAGARVPLGGER
jgi:hypothetical protein